MSGQSGQVAGPANPKGLPPWPPLPDLPEIASDFRAANLQGRHFCSGRQAPCRKNAPVPAVHAKAAIQWIAGLPGRQTDFDKPMVWQNHRTGTIEDQRGFAPPIPPYKLAGGRTE